MRLPGSVAEIEGSPAGPKVGAFFDLDGTLVAGFTGVIMTRDRLRRGQMGVGEFIGMVQAGLNHQLGRSEFEDLIGKGARMLRGSSLGDIDELAERLFVQKIMGRIYPEMRDLVRAHMARGHTVVLSSSALTVQVEPVARFLGHQERAEQQVRDRRRRRDHRRGAQTPIIWGPGKARAVQAFAAENGVDLSKSYFYADGDEDVALMYLVGNPRPTNPAGKLAAVAAKRGWPVLRFTSRSGSNPVSQLRTVAGVASMVPIAAGAVGLGLLTRNRRTGVNFFTSTFGRALLTATGVNINVLGKENLTKQRPAVFIFNHRNQVDPVIAGQAGQRQLHLGRQEGTGERPDRRHDRQADGRGVHRSRQPQGRRRRPEEGRGAGAQGPVHPDRARRAPGSTPPRSGPSRRAVPHRDVGRNPDRADRDPQRGGHRGPRLDDLQSRHRRRRRCTRRSPSTTGPWRTCRTASPRCVSSTSTR